ncbi:MAG: nitrile hydratase accessory protein [Rhizobiaceae bacterium]
MDDDGPVFREPWEASAFAMTLALYDKGVFSWSEWAETLGAVIAEDGGKSKPGDYYRLWLMALERLAEQRIGISGDELHGRQHAWEEAAARTPHGQPIEL